MDRRSSITSRDLECMLYDETAEPKALPLSLLEEITNGFSNEQQIGSGGFAVVYKGKLENKVVAVKRMFNTYMYEKEFQREVECLMMVKHTNVVRFLGYCADTQGTMTRHEGKFIMADVQQRLLCFEYLPNGSLHEYITDTSTGLQWRTRYQIIKGICHGLHYLHQKNIVHLDLKPGNILLDANFVAKISDFGLSRCFDDFQSRVKTVKIGGTMGYLAPEFYNGEITYHFDIYSLGVIIMEILTGKKGYHDVDKVVEIWSNMLEKTQRNVQVKQVRVCAEIGIGCIDSNPANRPDAQYIINILNEIESIGEYIEAGVITSQKAKNDLNDLCQDNPVALGETSSKVTDSPTKQAKQYTSSEEARPTPIKPGSVQLVIKNDNTVAPLLEHKKKVMVELTGGDYTSDRPGLDLVAVVDVSESMQGWREGQLKTAMWFLVQKLSPMDRLSVIASSNNKGKELWPLRQITEASQRELHDLISKIELSDHQYVNRIMNGLQAGLNVLAKREVRSGRVAAIMLVTSDTLYNYPPSSVDFGDVPVYTFYFHTGYDGPKSLAEITAKSMGGTFSHVMKQDSGGLTMAFSQCLAGLLSVAVQKLELTVAAVGGKSTIVKVTAGSYAQEKQQNENGDLVTIRFGNLYSSEVRKVIVELLLPTIHSEHSAEILHVTYSHDSSSTGRMKFVAPAERLAVWRTGVEFPEEKEKPTWLLREEARLQMVLMVKEARTMAASRRRDEAHDKLVEAKNIPELQKFSKMRWQLQKLAQRCKEGISSDGLNPIALSWESCHDRQRLAWIDRGTCLFSTPLMNKYLNQAKQFVKEPTMPLPSMEEMGAHKVDVTIASREHEMRKLAFEVVRLRPPPPPSTIPTPPPSTPPSSPPVTKFGGLFWMFQKK